METINNLASTAAKAVWGESNTTTTTANNETVHPGPETTTNETQGTEPISGKLGDTSKGEPFDAGNMESGAAKDTTQTGGGPAENPSTASLPGAAANETPTTKSKGPTAEQPSTTGDTHFKAAQADIRDPESADPKVESERKNVDDTGDLDKSENPDKVVDGPGPKPIDEVAQSRGGDAGKAEGGESSSAAGAGAGGDADADGPGAKSKGEGTGEQYVKSSGLAADGGDFDATKPGAGREADRLLEEKGVANPAVAAAASNKDEGEQAEHKTPDSPDSKEKKPGLKDKIKAKLHKN